MPSVESSPSFKIRPKKRRKKIKKQKKTLQVKVGSSLLANKTTNNLNLYEKTLCKRLVRYAVEISSFIVCAMSISARTKMINSVFIPMYNRDVAGNDSCFL